MRSVRWGRAAAVQEQLDKMRRVVGRTGFARVQAEMDATVLERLPAGMATACLIQAGFASTVWMGAGPEHPLTLISILAAVLVLVATLWVARNPPPAHWASPTWGMTAALLLFTLLLHHAWPSTAPFCAFKGDPA